jgi:hypothetical protein
VSALRWSWPLLFLGACVVAPEPDGLSVVAAPLAAPSGEVAPRRSTFSTYRSPSGPAGSGVRLEQAALADTRQLDQRVATVTLQQIERRLAGVERASAVQDLVDLARQRPSDVRIARRLAPLLHQRALLRYGRGEVAAAVSDWRLLLSLAGDRDAQIHKMLRRAEAEVRRSEAPRSGLPAPRSGLLTPSR